MKKKTALKDLVVITGFSGAGKSTVMHVFEDAGYFCVDNLPPEMIRSLIDLFMHEGSKVEKAAVVCDVRSGDLFEPLVEVINELERVESNCRVVFLEADEKQLIDRYQETRRRHPLAPSGVVAEGIEAERKLLQPLREKADIKFDTTGRSVATLRQKTARELLSVASGKYNLAVSFESFGFKHGLPRDVDLVFDVRFLPNPHYEPQLRELTGRDKSVVDFINADGDLDQFEDHLFDLLDYLLPKYVAEGRSYLAVAVGCTGGRHRSVAVVEQLKQRYREQEPLSVSVRHRDAGFDS